MYAKGTTQKMTPDLIATSTRTCTWTQKHTNGIMGKLREATLLVAATSLFCHLQGPFPLILQLPETKKEIQLVNDSNQGKLIFELSSCMVICQPFLLYLFVCHAIPPTLVPPLTLSSSLCTPITRRASHLPRLTSISLTFFDAQRTKCRLGHVIFLQMDTTSAL